MASLRYKVQKVYDSLGRKIGYSRLGAIRNLRDRYSKDIFFASSEDLQSADVVCQKMTSRSEYNQLVVSHDNKILKSSCAKKIENGNFRKVIIPGRCGVCGSKYGYMAAADINQEKSYREALGCVACRRVRRERVILEKIRELYETGKRKIYMYETGGNYELVKSYAKDAVGSEYISSDLDSGVVVNGILHEDAHNLSFGDECFDLLVSRDVFEHISDPVKCLKEAFRVLRGGGVCIVSIPWNPQFETSRQRAKFEDDELKYLDEPAYHWNPVNSSRNSLVFWDYGWDFIDFMKAAGFKEAYVQTYYDVDKGYLGDIGTYFVGMKSK